MTKKFVHLHCHTHYSLLDGANRIPELVSRTKELGMNAVAITDHGNLYGAIEFYRECREKGINPVVGYEAYLAPASRFDKKSGRQGDAYSHLTLLAKNSIGFRNLIKLSSIAFLEGFYYAPRIDREVLEAHSEGLICLSGCLAGEFNDWILKGQIQKAENLANWLNKVFKNDFYIEIQNNGLELQDRCTVEAVDISRRLGYPLVATADAHYLCQHDAEAHDVLFCINTGKKRDPNKKSYPEGRMPNPYYVRSPEDMYQLFPEFPDAVSRSQEIADRVDIQIDFKKRHFPVFVPPGGKKAEEYLREICLQGVYERYGAKPSEEVMRRFEHELGVIIRMGFASYFLIVWDFVRFAIENGIPCSARGSGCGALVSYALKLSHVDPLEYDLLFERFLDPNRSEAPDIDIDFCQDRREMVIDYVKRKYGENSVAQIATFGTLAAKAALKDVGRVLDIPLDRVNLMCKLVPMKGAIALSLEDAMTQVPEFKREYDIDPVVKQWVDIAMKLEGTNRNAGTHAAGVVIANGPITDYVPVQVVNRKDDTNGDRKALTTQWVMGDLEKVGMLKMDFLGLRTLTLVDQAVRLIKKTRNLELDVQTLPLDDQETYKMLQKGDAKGVFQFESEGIRELLKRMKPDNIRDIIASTALYRPGPLEGGMVDEYIDCKHGRKQPVYPHPIVEEVLGETYGVMVYQEQVMRILNRLGGIELSSTYACIKAISKKKQEIIDARKIDFIKGAQNKGLTKEKAEEFFNMIVKFGGYGFNKCLEGSTKLTDATTGERITIESLFVNRRSIKIHSLAENGKLVPRIVSDVVWNGRKKVYRLTTVSGFEITATANHPFRTLQGYKNLSELQIGDRIATAKAIQVQGEKCLEAYQLIFLAGLLSEGNTCHPSSLYCYGNAREFIDDFAQAAEGFPNTVARVTQRRNQIYEVCVNTGIDRKFKSGPRVTPIPGPNRSGAFLWLDSLGLVGKKAVDKFIPEIVFRLDDASIRLFLGRLWSGDGFIANQTLKVPFYATSSHQMASDLKQLLLRLGIISRIHKKRFRYRNETRPGYTVNLIGDHSVDRFAAYILPYCIARQQASQQLIAYLRQTERGISSKDTIPTEVKQYINQLRSHSGQTWKQVEQLSGLSVREMYSGVRAAKKGFRRTTNGRFAKYFQDRKLQEIAQSDIFWDRIESIESVGIRDTYDLTIEPDHNFVAEGFIVHNSHSAAYAHVSYQTAYLKKHYTPEFFAALLSSEIDDGNKRDMLVDHINDAKRFGVQVLPPDVNQGEANFTVQKNQIIFGLTAIKGVGRSAAQAIVDARNSGGRFKDLYDFCERVDSKQVGRAAIERLIKAGALDHFSEPFAHRAQLMIALQNALAAAESIQKDKKSGQMTFFDLLGGSDSDSSSQSEITPLPQVDRWSNLEHLKFEKEALDFYFSSHPLAEFDADLQRFATHQIGQLREQEHGQEVRIGGMLTQMKQRTTKRGDPFMVFQVEDFTGQVGCFMWSNDLTRYREFLKDDAILLFEGAVDYQNREDPQLQVKKVITLEQAKKELTKGMILRMSLIEHGPETVERICAILKRTPGPCVVYSQVRDAAGKRAQFRLSDEYRVHPAEVKVNELEMLLGPGAIIFTGR